MVYCLPLLHRYHTYALPIRPLLIGRLSDASLNIFARLSCSGLVVIVRGSSTRFRHQHRCTVCQEAARRRTHRRCRGAAAFTSAHHEWWFLTALTQFSRTGRALVANVLRCQRRLYERVSSIVSRHTVWYGRSCTLNARLRSWLQ